MPPLLWSLPTTSLLTFSSILVDPSSSYTSALGDATAARTKVQLALRAMADNQPGASALQVVDATQGYLPYLRGIVACLDADALLYRTEPTFPWSSALTHGSSSLLPLPSIHSEHLFLLLTYLLSLSNYAHHILSSLPEPTPSSPLSADEEKRLTAGLARAVDLLCQAAGVAEWAAEEVCPLVESERKGSQGKMGKGRWPIETSAESFRGLGMCLLADAHNVAVRKLLLPVLTHSLFSPPGPPLPSNHPSPSLLAKLYLHIASLYTSALAHLHIRQDTSAFPSSSRKLFSRSAGSPVEEPDTIDGEVIAPLKRYLRKESQLAQALAHKWLGVDVGENGKGQKIGEALSWTQDALARLEEMEDGKMRERMKGIGLGKGNERKKEERRARKGRVERELEVARGWVSNYKQLNGSVSFQPVPPVNSLVAPSGRPIFASKPFKPPAARFNPPHRSDEDEDDDEGRGRTKSVDEEAGESYAGKGSYY